MGRPLVIAVDFDGTLCEFAYPDIGKPIYKTLAWIRHRQGEGAKIILWTCRAAKELDEAIAWCRRFGLWFDAVNEDMPWYGGTYFGENKSTKVCADIYLDDRNITMDSL